MRRFDYQNTRSDHFVISLKATNDEKSDPPQKNTITGNNHGETSGSDSSDDMVVVPFNGLIGQENGQIFEKPIEQFDAAYAPTKSTGDMPGLPGSDERNDAIMNRIKERIADLKTRDEWRNDDESYGKNPLHDVAISEVMLEQMKVIRPIESFSEFTLTLCLLIFTTAFLTLFVGLNNDFDERFIEWWNRAEFDIMISLLR